MLPLLSSLMSRKPRHHGEGKAKATNQRIAVESGLSQLSQYLRDQGCEVVSMPSDQMAASGCNCCVISGVDQDMMGMQDTDSDQIVINADGMTAEEVYQSIQRRLNRNR